jgi:hypothetical protein
MMPPINADLGVRQYDVPHHFPRRRADAIGRFLQYRRDDFEYVAHHRRDERDHHDRQNDARRQHANAVGRALEQRTQNPQIAEDAFQDRLHVISENRREDEQPPHPVDDRGNGGEQFNSRSSGRLRNAGHISVRNSAMPKLTGTPITSAMAEVTRVP